jgi:two-component system KDP operon response regulator KdpE
VHSPIPARTGLGPGYEKQSQYLRVYVANLRKKLHDPAAPQLLRTERGMGYRSALPD